MADQEPLETTSQDADQLPERIRVHALAKRLGVTSKRILAKLTELGADARSAQSNVDRAVAESVRDALVVAEPDTAPPPADTEPSAGEPQTAEAAAPEPKQPEPAQPGGMLFSAPDAAHTGPSIAASASAQPTQLFTHVEQHEPQVAAPPVFEAPSVAAPLFLSPDAAAA
ncbi:translation initiation factor IF-2 N-terminal domain-containing protein, partial [Nocardia lijiangensis]|uniref:translation initiation factor IF-2 N-terminal domain-containing protein n=1 Tax=Nocardia lijiangensis TaxID=299618 RepID=UPI000AFFC458